MSPGNKGVDKLSSMIKKARKVRRFKPGDVVRPSKKRHDLEGIEEGIILSTERDNDLLQYCYVYWPIDNTDLRKEVRKLMHSVATEYDKFPVTIIVPSLDLEFVKSEPTWINPPTNEEVEMIRFTDVAEEL